MTRVSSERTNRETALKYSLVLFSVCSHEILLAQALVEWIENERFYGEIFIVPAVNFLSGRIPREDSSLYRTTACHQSSTKYTTLVFTEQGESSLLSILNIRN